MGFDRLTIMRPNLDIDPDDAPSPHQLTETRRINQRTTMSDPGFDDDIRFQSVNDLLQSDHVIRQLDNRPPQPRKAVDVFRIPPDS